MKSEFHTRTGPNNVMTARIVAKCSDLCYVTLMDAKGKAVAEHNGYVPEFMPGEHYGDYIELNIDLATGRILNWKKPSKKILSKPTYNSEWKIIP